MYGLPPQVTDVALNLLSFHLLLVRLGEVSDRFDGIQRSRFMFNSFGVNRHSEVQSPSQKF